MAETLGTDAAQLVEARRQMDELVYAVSHDLRFPVRVLSNYAPLLTEHYDDKLDVRGRRWLDYLSKAATNLNRMIDGLLELSRLGRREAGRSVVAMGDVLDEVVHLLSRQFPEAARRVSYRDLPRTWAHRPDMVQLVRHLVENALKFRSPKRRPRVEVTATPHKGGWRFCVEDNGIGFPPEESERVFSVFHRLHPRERYDGVGLGLALCRRIVAAHGGSMWAESTPERGSRFFFTLPRPALATLDPARRSNGALEQAA